MGRIDELIGVVADEVGADTSVLLDDSIAQRQLAIDRLVELATALSLRNLVELDRRKASDVFSGQSTGEWVALTERIAPGLARRRVRTARRLAERLAESEAAWIDGRVNQEHVRVLADAAANLRIGERIGELQGDLIRLAGELTFTHWRQMVIYLVRELDEDGAFDPDAELERNQATLTETLDGNCVVQARFDRVRYHRVAHHVEAKTDELFRHYSKRSVAAGGELPIPSRSCLRALAIYELIEAGAAVDGAPTVTGSQATVVLTPVQLPHDHPHHECRSECRSAGTAEVDDGPATDGVETTAATVERPCPDSDSDSDSDSGEGAAAARGDRRLFDLRLPSLAGRGTGATPSGSTVDAGVRLGTGVVDGWRAWTLDGTSLPGGSPELAALLCDATLEALIVGADATPLALGRSRRLFSAAQRRAQAIRDGGCVMPGCAMPVSATRSHHVRFWHRDQGPTDVDNGALLCDRDHGVPHRAGWDLFLTGDGWCWFRMPDGRSFWGQRHGHQRTGPTPDEDGYVEPAPRLATTTTGAPAPGRATATGPIEGRAPPDRGATRAEPRATRIPAERRHGPDDRARAAAVLTELRIRLRREADAEGPC